MANDERAVGKITDTCPMCGATIDLAREQIIICSECGSEGCTEHCIPGGRGTACVDCEADWETR